MPVFKCYICKNCDWHKNGREQKTRKNQQLFYKCKMCNNTIKITLYCITTRKAAKNIDNIINVVDGQGLANNYDRKIQVSLSYSSKNERQ